MDKYKKFYLTKKLECLIEAKAIMEDDGYCPQQVTDAIEDLDIFLTEER